jgi:hypothetical protein
MATVYGIKNVLDSRIYDRIQAYEGVGNIGFCGWGVRTRGSALLSGRTVLCQNYAANPGASISWLRFGIAAYAGGSASIIFSFWQKGPTAITYTRVGTVTITQDDIAMVSGTTYTWALDTPINFSSVSGTTCLVAVYSDTNVQLDYTSNTGSSDARLYVGNASANTTFDWDNSGSVSDQPYAVSAEAFDAPSSWDMVLDGGAVASEDTDWQDPLYCTSTEWSDPEHIYDGNGASIYIDLGSGFVPSVTGAWARENIFPDYGDYGVRAVYKMFISGTIQASGGISVSYSDTDSEVAPGAGYETIYWNDTPGAFSDDEIAIPVVARWIKITEVGTSATDEVSEFEIQTFSYHVTDGRFFVESSQNPNAIWLESYPASDKAYVMTLANIAGAESPATMPITNRRYCD